MCVEKKIVFVIDRSESMDFSKSYVLDKAFNNLKASCLGATFMMFSSRVKIFNEYPFSLKARGNTNLKRLFKALRKCDLLSVNTIIIFISDALFTNNRWEKQYLKLLLDSDFKSCLKYAIGTNLFSYEQERYLSLLTLNKDNVFPIAYASQLEEFVKTILDNSNDLLSDYSEFRNERVKEINRLIKSGIVDIGNKQ
jgi:hypothetical protein